MDSSKVYRFHGEDPFDNWTFKDGVLMGYYPRNSLINALSKEAQFLKMLLLRYIKIATQKDARRE